MHRDKEKERQQQRMKKLLVTGASGFIGSSVVERGLQLGMEVWAAVRPTSSRAYLRDERIRFVELDLSDASHLDRQLAAHQAEHGAWHYVVHAAGVTKCLDAADFDRVNAEGTHRLAEALARRQMVSEKFVFLSSLSVMGPCREERVARHACAAWGEKSGLGAPLTASEFRPIVATDRPQPNTAYGRSKWRAEQLLSRVQGLPCVVLRPTGVYGPRERDYYLMARSIAHHLDFAAGLGRQEITFVYVQDLVQAVFLALERARAGSLYQVSDGNVYASRAFSDLLQAAMGTRGVLHLKAPLPLLRALCAVGDVVARATHKPFTLNNDKYRIMSQRNWRCDIEPLCTQLGYRPQYDLRRGVAETVKWYKQHRWI